MKKKNYGPTLKTQTKPCTFQIFLDLIHPTKSFFYKSLVILQKRSTGKVPSSGPGSKSNFNFHSWSCSLAIFGSKATRNITQSNCRCLSLLMFQPAFQLTVILLSHPLNLQCCCMVDREQPLASTKTFELRSCRFGSSNSQSKPSRSESMDIAHASNQKVYREGPLSVALFSLWFCNTSFGAAFPTFLCAGARVVQQVVCIAFIPLLRALGSCLAAMKST